MRLQLTNAEKRFGAMQALAPVNLDVQDGEFISIVGPSGCGKSTLMRMVAGLLPVSGGTVQAGGRMVTGPVTELGIVFQQPVLLDWRNALDNVLFQVEMRGQRPGPWRDRALALLDQVGLKDFAASYPHALSGGMRQRVAIARALVHEPGLRRKMTVLFVTHSVDEAVLLADRVVVMSPRPGRVEQVLTIDLPRPRGLAARRNPEFLRAEEQITGIFLDRGVLSRGGTAH